MAFCSNGTGMILAADCNTVRTSFPVAVIYSLVVGAAVWEFSDNFRMKSVLRAIASELAQHKLVPTSTGSVSVLGFLTPHGMGRRHQEEQPTPIVRNQCTAQYGGSRWGTASRYALYKETLMNYTCQRSNYKVMWNAMCRAMFKVDIGPFSIDFNRQYRTAMAKGKKAAQRFNCILFRWVILITNYGILSYPLMSPVGPATGNRWHLQPGV